MTRVLGGSPGRLTAMTPGPSIPKARARFTDPLARAIVPPGSLDRWFAWAANPVGRRDLLACGDSTTFGAEGTNNNYSWLDRFRQKWVESGRPDGGKGLFGGGENTKTGRDFPANEVNGWISQTFGGGFPDAFDITGGQAYYDTGTSTNHTLALQFRGTAARLWFSARAGGGGAGDLGVSIDGGAETLVHAYRDDRADTVVPGGREPNPSRYEVLSGLSANAVHTITIRNRGGRDAVAPIFNNVSQNGSPGLGTYPAATWWYKVSAVFGGGETLPSAAKSWTNGNNTDVSVQLVLNGADSYRLYRSATQNGTYALATNPSWGTSATLASTNITGATTWDSAQNPPTVGTSNLNTSGKNAYVHLAPMFDTGLTIQNYATSGGTFNTFIGPQQAASSFGLTYVGPAATGAPTWADRINPANYQRWDTGVASPYAINPVLAVLNLGFNDLTGGAGAAALCTQGVQLFAALCNAAGVDGLVQTGQLPYNASWPTYGAAAYTALRDASLAAGLAFVDMLYPIAGPSLSYTSGTRQPHLLKAEYQAQADYLWDFLLRP